MSSVRKPAHLDDVARLAGVSTATVSRAISGRGPVNTETRKRIDAAIQKLGYVAHGAARALASRRTHTIGAVIPGLDYAIFASTANALQSYLDRHGYMLIVACNEYDLDAELRLTKNLIARGIDGLVLVGTEHHPELFALINAFGLPYVLTWAHDESGRLPCVGFNHRKATAEVTQHLVDLGHREFAVISAVVKNNDRVRQRLAGVTETLERNGLALRPERLVQAPFSYESGSRALDHFLEYASRPTAIVCLNDVFAIGAMAACARRKLRVPDHVSITGCEDLEIAAMVLPPLTTVRFPTVEMGRHAASYLVAKLTGEGPPLQQMFPTQLILRSTTAPPPAIASRAHAKNRRRLADASAQ